MSLTIIALVVAVAAVIFSLTALFAVEEYEFPALIVGSAFAGIAVGAAIIAIGSYNSNVRDSKEMMRTDCVEQGFDIIRYNATEYCVEPGSRIIRIL